MAQEASFGLSRSNTSHPRLNLVTAIGYRKGADGELAACHEYQYDALMRPIQRRDSWDTGAPVTVRDFTYNRRCELVEDRISLGGSFSYRYDNIGNRKTARELEEAFSYESNQLNQYAEIAGGGGDFTPVYDADGNQTRIRTSTGIWESPTTLTTAPSSSPARMAGLLSLVATTTRDGASRRRSPSMGQYPAIAGTCTGTICR